MYFAIFNPLTRRYYMLNLVENGPMVPEKKLKKFRSLQPTNDERRTTNDGQKTIAKGHVSDSVDFKNFRIVHIWKVYTCFII